MAWVSLGTGEARLRALQYGAIDAVVLGARERSLLAESDDFWEVADLSRQVRLLWSGLVTSDSVASTRRAALRRFLKATWNAVELFRDSPDRALALLERHMRRPKNDLAPEYESSVATMTMSGVLSYEVQEQSLKIMRRWASSDGALRPEQVFRFEPLTEARGEPRSSSP